MNQLKQNQVPLGYSDLTLDEGWIISLFREWRQGIPTRAIAEHRISRTLRREQKKDQPENSDPFFRIFSICDETTGTKHFDTDILSKDEENLLFLLSDAPPKTPSETSSYQDITNCRAALKSANVNLRPLVNIERSGRDAQLIKAARRYLSFLGGA
ncbi:MAG: hypothetical protein AAGG45_09255 [Pseudomonadota bacterium]